MDGKYCLGLSRGRWVEFQKYHLHIAAEQKALKALKGSPLSTYSYIIFQFCSQKSFIDIKILKIKRFSI